MTREEVIQKEAERYAYENMWYPGETSYESDIIAMTDSFAKAFKDGIEWADRHPAKKQLIWHNSNDTPSENSKIVVIDTKEEWYNISYSFDEYDDCFGKGWESCVRTYNIHKWAYLTDLTNL